MRASSILSENPITLAEAAKAAPGRPSVNCVWRWATRPNRFGVKLETIRIGSRLYTSQAAFERFVAATTAAAEGQPIQARTSRQRERDIADAEREFDALTS